MQPIQISDIPNLSVIKWCDGGSRMDGSPSSQLQDVSDGSDLPVEEIRTYSCSTVMLLNYLRSFGAAVCTM